MPDGTTVWVRVDGAPTDTSGGDGGAGVDEFGGQQGVDVARRRGQPAGDGEPARLHNFVETVRSVAASVHEAVAGMAPTGVSVEFGVELSVESSHIVAVLAHVGAKTSVKVRLDWDRAALQDTKKQAENAEPTEQAENAEQTEQAELTE